MSLVGGSALQIEDLDIILNCVTFITAEGRAALKYKGRTSKRRYENILKMARKRELEKLLEYK